MLRGKKRRGEKIEEKKKGRKKKESKTKGKKKKEELKRPNGMQMPTMWTNLGSYYYYS